MSFFDKIDKFNALIEKIQDFFDTSLTVLQLSFDSILCEKIKLILKKYALYDEINARDVCFNGFGLFEIEFVGKEKELENFKIVLNKTIFDYLRVYYLTFTKTKAETEKIGENQYIVRVYYSFSKKTLKSYNLYFNETMNYKKQEVLENEMVQDEELEREMKEWNI